jgi:sterol desaturase/sphingolipid hydroxylase (fatty acid hydroxylase superfamily)
MLWVFAVYITGFVVWEWNRLRQTAGGYPWVEVRVSLVIMAMRRLLLLAGLGGITLSVYQVAYRLHWFDLTISRGDNLLLVKLLALFVGVEFCYYWQHRTMHQCRWLWADHSVHHSPNRLVVLVAERLGLFSSLTGAALFFLPLCVLGFPPTQVLAMVSFNLVYQFWLHTEQIGKLGWFEFFFNTPSHHRVHHAANARYLDANYGGVLILFDRLFGTFIEEDAAEPVRFGLVKPQVSRNPLTVALAEWRAMLGDVATHWRQPLRALHYLFNVPGWSHDGSRETSAAIKNNQAMGVGK